MVESSGELTAHITAGATAVYAIETLKRSQWFPWLTADTKSLNRLVNVALAAAAAFGINWNYDANTGTLMITGLTTTAAMGMLWEFLKQYVVQQLVYDGVVHKGGSDESETEGNRGGSGTARADDGVRGTHGPG